MSRSTKRIGDSPDPTRVNPAIAVAISGGVVAIIVATINLGSLLIAQRAMAVSPETLTLTPPTSTFTLVPTQTATYTPTPTSTPTATSTPTTTATPTWLARITYPKLTPYPPVTRFIDLMGEYRADVTDDIWVWVQDPGGLYYPASMNPCEGKSTPKVNGKWEIYVGVGVEDSSGLFNIVITLTTPEASMSIGNALREGCRTGIFPGFASLPPGTTEVERGQVTRNPVTGAADTYPAPPPIPDAGLPGTISVNPFGSGGTVAQEEIMSGGVSGSPEAIWALVYTFYGRWYPQSYEPCNGVHTQRDGDQWSAKLIFGGDWDPGKPFYTVVVLANAQASAFFDQKQRQFCAANHYPGFLTIELPDGLSQKYSIRVIRR